MEFLKKPPEALTNILPEGARTVLENGGWYAVLGIGGLIILLLLWAVLSRIGHALFGRRPIPEKDEDLELDLDFIPAPPPLTGDRRLTVEGVPARLRLVVLALAGRAYDINAAAVHQILDRVLPGLANIARDDRPQVRIWPFQLSYEGFANQFHRNVPAPEGEGEPSRWILLAGRAQLDKNQIMLGLALQAVKPTTVGRLRLERHDWSSVLRIKTRD